MVPFKNYLVSTKIVAITCIITEVKRFVTYVFRKPKLVCNFFLNTYILYHGLEVCNKQALQQFITPRTFV